MIYYYHCYRGAHLSSVAAAIHLELLPQDPTMDDILNLEYFDKLQFEDMGTPVLAGYDEQENPVYFVGLGKGTKVFDRFADSIIGELGLDLEFQSIDCLCCLDVIIRTGGFLSNRTGFKSLGRRLAAWGVRRKIGEIRTMVLQAKGN